MFKTNSMVILFENLRNEKPERVFSFGSVHCGCLESRPEECVIYLTVNEMPKDSDKAL